jgi:hypothetical protein
MAPDKKKGHMKTDDLLKQATPRPWWREDAGFIAGEAGCMVADFDCNPSTDDGGLDIDEREANKALATRAVNSFEALRAIVQEIANNERCVCEEAGLEEGTCLCCAANKALALAEGESEVAHEKRKAGPVSPKLATLLSAAGDVIESRDCECSGEHRCSICELSEALMAFSESEVGK